MDVARTDGDEGGRNNGQGSDPSDVQSDLLVVAVAGLTTHEGQRGGRSLASRSQGAEMAVEVLGDGQVAGRVVSSSARRDGRSDAAAAGHVHAEHSALHGRDDVRERSVPRRWRRRFGDGGRRRLQGELRRPRRLGANVTVVVVATGDISDTTDGVGSEVQATSTSALMTALPTVSRASRTYRDHGDRIVHGRSSVPAPRGATGCSPDRVWSCSSLLLRPSLTRPGSRLLLMTVSDASRSGSGRECTPRPAMGGGRFP